MSFPPTPSETIKYLFSFLTQDLAKKKAHNNTQLHSLKESHVINKYFYWKQPEPESTIPCLSQPSKWSSEATQGIILPNAASIPLNQGLRFSQTK